MTLPSTAIVLVPHTLLLWERGAPLGGGREVDSAFTGAPGLRDIYAACTT